MRSASKAACSTAAVFNFIFLFLRNRRRKRDNNAPLDDAALRPLTLTHFMVVFFTRLVVNDLNCSIACIAQSLQSNRTCFYLDHQRCSETRAGTVCLATLSELQNTQNPRKQSKGLLTCAFFLSYGRKFVTRTLLFFLIVVTLNAAGIPASPSCNYRQFSLEPLLYLRVSASRNDDLTE
jgi:hypothetical protein